MKKILIICLVLLNCNMLYSQIGNLRFLQSGIGVDYKAQAINVAIASENQNLAVIRGEINRLIAASRVNWVHVTNIRVNVVTLVISQNNTPDERHCELGSREEGNYLTISQGGKVDLKNFDASSSVIIPGMLSSVYLSGSEVGVIYRLSGTGVLESMNGTGGPLVFEGNFPAGTYQVMAYKGNSFLKMGKDVQIKMSVVINNVQFSKNSIILPTTGGSEKVKVIFNTQRVPKETLAAELQNICLACNAGKVTTWNKAIQINYTYDDFLEIVAKPCTPKSKHGTLALGRPLVVRQPGRKVIMYKVMGKEYVRPDEKFTIVLSGSEYIRYNLYCNEKTIRTESGGNKLLKFQNLSRLGTYTVKAVFEDTLVSMDGEVNVKIRDGRPNYIATKTYTDVNKYVQDITFMDDLGRVAQKTNIGATPSGKDLITPIHYDHTGRASRVFLPYVSESGDSLHDKYEQEQSNYYTALYGTNHYAYSDVVYDNSPKDQVIEQSSPGASWRLGGGHTVRTNTRKNTAEDHIKRCIARSSNVLLLGEYPAGSLSVKQKINQENKESYEYYDSEGHLIAKESRVSASERYITFYVYNDAGRLSHIIPPALSRQIMAESAAYVVKNWADLSKYCYYMEYDKYGNIYKQYVPGAGYTITLYDKRGRMVLSQDARQRSQSPEMWSFTKYDELNRPVISGICTGTEADHTSALAEQTVFGEARGNAASIITAFDSRRRAACSSILS